MTLIPWRNGQSMVWDATCSDTLAPSYLRLSSKSPGRVANKAANIKLGKYKKLIEDNYIIIPFAIETLGPWCTEAIKFIDVLGKLLANVTNEKKSKLYLKQRISIALQRSNAACIMGTFDGDLKKLDEIYYIL
ncbi:uncharacterized protein LOC119069340 [Bradysia coprophila]|uniref:uncharacterized protein LOC119069340 n=1 Tax=Bradysia coprophila TaxID=38358 RepID=UPI00187D949F|nr:uncharacterized protein LOC119069340 [Bradysia coprophila]